MIPILALQITPSEALGAAVAVGVALLGYGITALVAWGRVTARIDTLTKGQEKLVTSDALRAAIAEMKNDLADRIETKIEKALESRPHRSTDDKP